MVWGWATLAVLFAVVWIWAFYREDKYEREPLGMVARAVFWGVVSFIYAMMIERFAMQWQFLTKESLASRAALMLAVVGPVEELCKFAAVRVFIYPRRAFNEPMDGIVYSVAAATGFALVENLYFMVGGDPKEILIRGPGYTLVHIVFAGYWGSALGWAKLMENRRATRRLVLLGLTLAALTHGVFDLVVFAADRELSQRGAQAAALVLVILSYAALRWQMRRAIAASPFRQPRGKQEGASAPSDDASS